MHASASLSARAIRCIESVIHVYLNPLPPPRTRGGMHTQLAEEIEETHGRKEKLHERAAVRCHDHVSQ